MNNISPKPSRDFGPARYAVSLAVVFMVAASLAVLVFAYVAVQTGAWQAYAVIAAFVGFFSVEALVVRLARQNRSETAGVLLIVGVCYIVFAMTSLMEGIGLALSIALALVIVEIIFATLTGPLAARARLMGLAFAIGILLMDRVVPWNRPSFTLVQQAIPAIAAGTLVTLAFLLLRRLFFWQDLSMARKLLAAFGALALLALSIGVVAYLGLRNVQKSYESALSEGEALELISLHMNSDLLTARRHEKDFLLRWQEQGFSPAFENYVVPHQLAVGEIRQHIDEISIFAPLVARDLSESYTPAQYGADLAVLKDSIDLYDQNFLRTVQLIQEKGFEDTGLEGEFRNAVHKIEDRIYGQEGLEPLVITMLQIRRREKDYLLRNDQIYIDYVHQYTADLKEQIASSEQLEPAEKTEMAALTDQYLIAFDKLVEKNVEIAASIEAFRDAAHTMEPLVDKLTATGAELSRRDVASARTNSTRSLLISTAAMALALLVAFILTVTLSRQITQPVKLLTESAHDLESGNYDAHAEVTSRDEIGTLAGVFNNMAKQLKQSVALVTKRAAELQTVATISTAASTVLDIQVLLQSVVDLTKENFDLYHSHIYLLNEAGDTLVLTAGAGDVGRQMVAEKRTIAVHREQSLVARAARTSKGAIVNDVTKEPDFLPNPLLPHTLSEMAIPMIAGNTVVGVFDVQADLTDRFTEEDVRIQTTLAAQIAVALQNARSYAAARQRAERETLIRSIGQNIQSTTTIESALQIVARELGRALGSTETRVILDAPVEKK